MCKVVAIIVNWNQKALTIDAVQSLLNSDYSDLEVIVVDNGSSDGSADAILQEFPTVDVIQNKNNLGFAEGNNLGIKLALSKHADYLFIFNNDATVDHKAISKLVSFLNKTPHAGGVAPYILYSHDRNLIWYGGGIVRLWRGRIAHNGLRTTYDLNTHESSTTGYLTGCAFLVRAGIIDRVGGFDKIFGMYSEDVDLSFKIIQDGWELWVVPDSIVYHCVSVSSGGEISPFKAFHRGRSAMLLVKRWLKVWQLPTLIIGGIIGGLIISAKLVITGNSSTVIAIWSGIIRGLTGAKIPQKYALDYPIGDEDA